MYVTIGALKRLTTLMAGQLKSAVSITGGSISSATITGGSINSATVGATTPSTGAFTTVTATSVSSSGINSLSVANALTAVGTDRATSLVLSKEVNNITTAGAGTGATLPAAVVGNVVIVFNAGANAIKVYGNGTDTIDGAAAATGVTLTNAKRCAFVCVAANTFISFQLGVVSA